MRHYHDFLNKLLFLEETTEIVHSSLQAHCSYRLKFHLRNSSFYNRRLPGTRFARSTRPSQRSKYTEGVAQRMRRCVAIQRLSRKCVQKKNTPGPGGQVVPPQCHTCVVLRMRRLVWHMHHVCAIHISEIVCTITRSSSWYNG